MACCNILRSMKINQSKGFTLMETLVTLVIASILVTAAVPAMQDFIVRNRMTAEVNTFMASLNLARSEAVKRLQNVEVCPADSGFTKCINSTDWEDGWMVFIDKNNDGIVTSGSDKILQRDSALPSRFQIIGNQTEFSYAPTGQLYNAGTNGHYDFCDTANVAQARRVIVSREGRVRVSQVSTTCS